MWDNWKPIQDIRSAWEGASSIWGKLKVGLFYSFIWIFIFCSAILVLKPSSLGTACMSADEASRAWIALTMRTLNVYAFAFGLYVERGGSTLPNMRFLVGIMILSKMVGFLSKSSIADQDCYESINQHAWIWVCWPIVAMICAYVERHTSSDGAGENRPLVS